MASDQVNFVICFEDAGQSFEILLSPKEAPRLSRALCRAEQLCEQMGWRLLRVEDRQSGEALEPCPRCLEEEARGRVCTHCQGNAYVPTRPAEHAA
ncbi:hypothetical protein Mterra_03059 [Calidithermus terrae]|uniref:Uncharacterized protein n=1 Tax=Calidithermus terrae TaxID=1408545 RepID=A0A399ECE6_9DEIN|nr:hypothetical protein [Calidithermus terrae]RIH81608.1 hypothetical protein Mterra_03059 [Calidithermus terrae]